MIVIINGAPGAGKTFLLENLENICEQKFVPVKKYTTRFPRNFEKNQETIDLRYGCEKEFIEQLDYNYVAKGKSYGIDKNEIESIVDSNKIPVMIIRSFETIRKIKEDFEDVCVIFIIGGTGKTLNEKLEEQGRAQKEIALSDSNFRAITNDYIENIDYIDYCIINSLYDKDLYLKQFTAITQGKLKR